VLEGTHLVFRAGLLCNRESMAVRIEADKTLTRGGGLLTWIIDSTRNVGPHGDAEAFCWECVTVHQIKSSAIRANLTFQLRTTMVEGMVMRSCSIKMDLVSCDKIPPLYNDRVSQRHFSSLLSRVQAVLLKIQLSSQRCTHVYRPRCFYCFDETGRCRTSVQATCSDS